LGIEYINLYIGTINNTMVEIKDYKNLTEDELDVMFYKNEWRNNLVDKKKTLQSKKSKLEDIFSCPSNYNVTVLNSIDKIDQWIINNIYNKTNIVGIDTEFNCNSLKILRIITIATLDSCLIIRTFLDSKGVPEQLEKLIYDDSITKIMYGVKSDINHIVNWLNTRYKLNKLQLPSFEKAYQDISYQNDGGLQQLCRDILNKELTKDPEITFSRWSKHLLTHEQIKYASEDAYCTLLIYLSKSNF